MSTIKECCSPCPTVSTTDIPGSAGASAFSLTTAAFVIPAVLANVTVPVTNTSWMVANENVFTGNANFKISSFNSGASTVTLTNLGFTNDAAVGVTVASGSVIAAGVGNVAELTGVNQFTDNSTGASGDTIAAGVGVSIIPFFVNLVDIGNADLLTNYTPGYKFKILAVHFAVEKAATTAAKLATITPKISGVSVTGGVLSLTSANCTPQGNVVSGSAVTALNTGSAAATISLTGSGVTAFVEGSGWILLRIQSMDTADAFASISSKMNSLITSVLT